MNVRMWLHKATQRNVAQLKADGVRVIDPAEGEMACGEYGPGRLAEPQAILDQLSDLLA
jgi:phosphopantothenoylcysteine decarboxylase/phosphopantothenate--cysteine ligase